MLVWETPFSASISVPKACWRGAIPLSLANSGIRAALGKLFTWKFSILLAVIALSVLFYRPFCKWLCPLGAFYALLNKVSLFQMKVDNDNASPAANAPGLQDGRGRDENAQPR